MILMIAIITRNPLRERVHRKLMDGKSQGSDYMAGSQFRELTISLGLWTDRLDLH